MYVHKKDYIDWNTYIKKMEIQTIKLLYFLYQHCINIVSELRETRTVFLIDHNFPKTLSLRAAFYLNVFYTAKSIPV